MKHIGLLALTLGCMDEPLPPEPTVVPSESAIYDLEENPAPKLDLLIVIDDSTAMAGYQQRLVDLPAAMQATLRTVYAGIADLRIGVTSSDGVLRTSAVVPDGVIVDVGHFDGTRETNYAGTLAAALESLVMVGAEREPPASPLGGMQLALDNGFARDSSYLAIVTISAGDDQSPGAVMDYANVLKARRSDPSNVSVSTIYNRPAARLDDFTALFINRAAVVDIDQADWAPVFGVLTRLHRTTLEAPCFREPLDVDQAVEGAQYECAFAWIDHAKLVRSLPGCGSAEPSPMRCYHFESDPDACDDATVALRVRGFPSPLRPAIRGQCVVRTLTLDTGMARDDRDHRQDPK